MYSTLKLLQVRAETCILWVNIDWIYVYKVRGALDCDYKSCSEINHNSIHLALITMHIRRLCRSSERANDAIVRLARHRPPRGARLILQHKHDGLVRSAKVALAAASTAAVAAMTTRPATRRGRHAVCVLRAANVSVRVCRHYEGTAIEARLRHVRDELGRLIVEIKK